MISLLNDACLRALVSECALESRRRVTTGLLALLRAEAALPALGAGAPRAPVLSVEFCTTEDEPDGTYWDATSVYFKHGDGTEARVDLSGSPAAAHLAEFSRFARPLHNSNLEVDLVAGEFVETGPHWQW
ncbi:hypothetical protein AB0N09_27930 [Streptomyces erythrochromogenes]|uniref:hypothetical protein n=1 Tax=Streptomyces erythrochromogenes TaxID=285574 RepID=UPI00341C7738